METKMTDHNYKIYKSNNAPFGCNTATRVTSGSIEYGGEKQIVLLEDAAWIRIANIKIINNNDQIALVRIKCIDDKNNNYFENICVAMPHVPNEVWSNYFLKSSGQKIVAQIAAGPNVEISYQCTFVETTIRKQPYASFISLPFISRVYPRLMASDRTRN